ncbi:MAG: SBBP repeat-containing protein, partial [Acidobacteriota bacterium]
MNLPAQLALVCLFSPVMSGFAPSEGAGSQARMPFSFVENRGQTDARVRYIGTGPQFKAWFYDEAVAFQQGTAVTRVRFEGAHPRPRIEATDPLGATASYLRGSNRAAWQSDLPLFGAIHYLGVWPGIEIRFKAEQSQTKAEYVVSPGASIAEIRLHFEGKAAIQPDGSLVVSNETGEFREDKPVLYQNRGASRIEVPGAFIQLEDGAIGFGVPVYDRTKPLVIDPSIIFSGYFGGSAQSTITAVAVNSWYNTIVAGWTIGTDLPATGGAKPRNAGGVDAFVAGFSPDGGKLLFCTYLGGSGDDRAFGVAVDSANNTYVTGYTSSANFPVVGGVQTKLKGVRDAFVAKLNPAGSALVYSTYLGGTGVDTGNAIAVDANQCATIIGDTTSTNLPVTPGTFQPALAGSQDAFVARLAANGASVAWLTYFGGSGSDHGAALKLDAAGAIFVVGSTTSSDFPVIQAAQPQSGGGQDGFVAKLAADGKSFLFSTYLGGSGGTPGAPEAVNAVSLGYAGNLMVAGVTSSPDFPVTPPALQLVFGGGQTDGFISRFDQNTGALQRSMFVGGAGDDGITGMVADVYSNFFWITGYTGSTDFPTQNAAQPVNGGGLDAFIAGIGFSRRVYSSYLGGSGNDTGNAIAIDSTTNIVIAGSVASAGFPAVGSVGKVKGA